MRPRRRLWAAKTKTYYVLCSWGVRRHIRLRYEQPSDVKAKQLFEHEKRLVAAIRKKQEGRPGARPKVQLVRVIDEG